MYDVTYFRFWQLFSCDFSYNYLQNQFITTFIMDYYINLELEKSTSVKKVLFYSKSRAFISRAYIFSLNNTQFFDCLMLLIDCWLMRFMHVQKIQEFSWLNDLDKDIFRGPSDDISEATVWSNSNSHSSLFLVSNATSNL